MTRNVETKGSYVMSFNQSPITYVLIFVNFHGHEEIRAVIFGQNGKISGMILGKERHDLGTKRQDPDAGIRLCEDLGLRLDTLGGEISSMISLAIPGRVA